MVRTEDRFIGRSLEGLSLIERTRLTGKWMAQELYSPERLPLRTIEALGIDVPTCMDALRRRGLNPARYHYQLLEAPYRE